MSKLNPFIEEIEELFAQEVTAKQIGLMYAERSGLSAEYIRKYIARHYKLIDGKWIRKSIAATMLNQSTDSDTSPNDYANLGRVKSSENVGGRVDNEDYQMAAMIDGKMMDIDAYCEHYGLPREDITSYKLVSHTGVPYYNIVFKEKLGVAQDDFNILEELEKQIGRHESKPIPTGENWGVITISDIHFGAYISAMTISPDFNISILLDMLEYAAHKINKKNYDVVHVHCLGDLIESFSGLNHKDSWRGLGKGMYGANVIKLFTQTFHERFLSKINNLGEIKLVGGNHDRLAADKAEDDSGGAADLVAWGLELMGYNVDFHPVMIKHIVGNVCNLLFHGDKGLSKQTTKDLCWTYGEKGYFNFIKEGHLHTRIKKLNAKTVQEFKLVKDDNIDCRRQICASFFTGNAYSEGMGFTTKAGFSIEESNGGFGVDVLDCSIDSPK